MQVNESLSRDLSKLSAKEKETVFKSFSDLLRKMVGPLVNYIQKNQKADSPTVPLPVSEAREKLRELNPEPKEAKSKEEESKIDLDATADRMMDAFLSEGPLTRRKSGSEPIIELPRLAKGFEETANKFWKSRAIAQWASNLAHGAYSRFVDLYSGIKVTGEIEQYTDEERILLGDDLVELYPIRELPCGEFAILKSGEKRIVDRLKNLDPDISYENLLKSWGYKQADEPSEGDLIVVDSPVHVLWSMGDGKVRSKYGNDARYWKEENFKDIAERWKGHFSIWRRPS